MSEVNPDITGPEIEEHFQRFSDFILHQDHPCVMAQSVFSLDHVKFRLYSGFSSKETSKKLLQDLEDYLDSYDFGSNEFKTFIAGFYREKDLSEREFEEKLWKQLRSLHREDIEKNAWDSRVSSDPEDGNFSFSLGGRAFYVVGMHPRSCRESRQSPFPAMVFNLHWQFEKLREMGVYPTIRDKIRNRDRKLQGSTNPMLQDFGTQSEARQYSGRRVPANWKCPFHKEEDPH